MSGGRTKAAAALALVASMATVAHADSVPLGSTPVPVTITVQAQVATTGTRLHFRVQVPAAGRRATTLVFARSWGGATGLEQGVRNLSAASPGARLVDLPGGRGGDDDNPVFYRIEHPPTGDLAYTYEIVEFGEPRLDDRRFFQPILRPDYAQAFGYGVLLLPVWAANQKMLVRWHFDLPAGWAVATSFGAEPAQAQARQVRWPPQRVDQSMLRHSVIALGDFRLRSVRIEGQSLWVALRGSHPFSDGEFLGRTAALVRAQREFFGDHDFAHYLVTLIPNDFERGRASGTQVYNAFAMNVSRDFTVPSAPFEILVAHEGLHTWIPIRFGGMDSSPDARDQALRYWFSEGFTNFLMHRMLVQTGQWSVEDYARNLNGVIRKYESSEARERDNAVVRELFFTDRAVGDLPYQRGELLALHWDAQLRSRGTSLAALLKALVLPTRDRGAHGEAALATDRLLVALRPALGDAPRGDVEQIVERGAPIPYRDALLGPCFTMQPAVYARYELGFDFEATLKDRRVTGVVPNGAAAGAGLREGDAIRRAFIDHGDIDRDVTMQIERDGQVVDLAWRPVSREHVQAARFAPRPQAETDPACRAWMALQ